MLCGVFRGGQHTQCWSSSASRISPTLGLPGAWKLLAGRSGSLAGSAPHHDPARNSVLLLACGLLQATQRQMPSLSQAGWKSRRGIFKRRAHRSLLLRPSSGMQP